MESHNLRIQEIEFGGAGIVTVRAVRENRRIYTSFREGSEALGQTPATGVGAVGLSNLLLLDTTLFRDADDGPGFYAAAAPASGDPNAWHGAGVMVSDDKISWNVLAALPLAATSGFAETALPSADWTTWDRTGTVDIRLLYGSLSNFSEDDALAELSPILLGDEVLMYTTATQLASDRYRLEGALIRGRRGTDWAVGAHAAGERFLFLDPLTVARISTALSEWNQTRYYRAFSVGQVTPGVVTYTFINTMICLKPYSPVNIAGSRDGSNNLTITWDRRSRIWGNWSASTPPPLGEAAELYDVEFWDTAFTSLKRTVTPQPTSRAASYSAADQTTDGFTPGDPVGVKIYQISADVGRGFPGQAVI